MNYKRFYNVILDDKGRRHWKVNEEKVQKVEEKDAEKRVVSIDYSKALEARTDRVQGEKKIGVRRIEKDLKDVEKFIGYYCKMCDFSAKDNHAWLDHLNSPEHNRMLGNHMKVEKITADSVGDYILSLKQKKPPKAAPKLESILQRLDSGEPIKKPKLHE